MTDDLERLRIADADFDLELESQLPPEPSAVPDFVGLVTTDTTFPTAAKRFFKIIPQIVLGTESEGSSGVFTSRTDHVYAENLGPNLPVSGTTRVVCSWVDNRWVFDY